MEVHYWLLWPCHWTRLSFVPTIFLLSIGLLLPRPHRGALPRWAGQFLTSTWPASSMIRGFFSKGLHASLEALGLSGQKLYPVFWQNLDSSGDFRMWFFYGGKLMLYNVWWSTVELNGLTRLGWVLGTLSHMTRHGYNIYTQDNVSTLSRPADKGKTDGSHVPRSNKQGHNRSTEGGDLRWAFWLASVNHGCGFDGAWSSRWTG